MVRTSIRACVVCIEYIPDKIFSKENIDEATFTGIGTEYSQTFSFCHCSEKDASARVSEALVRTLVTQLCKDLPAKTQPAILNPNEDDLPDTPLAVLFLQLETVAKEYSQKQKKRIRAKRQKTVEDEPSQPINEMIDVESIVSDPSNCMSFLPEISHSELIDIINRNISKYAKNTSISEDETDDRSSGSLCLTKSVINAFTNSQVIELVKEKLMSMIGSYDL